MFEKAIIHYILDNFIINELRINYYLSPLLDKNGFNHAFFTKKSFDKNFSLLSKNFCESNQNFHLNQIHSNLIVLASKNNFQKKIFADGIISDKHNQNLWIYTADCMPILLADKENRRVAALHCGRLGLEKNIIHNVLKKFDKLGTSRDQLLVAIGPSISNENYEIDRNTLIKFLKNSDPKNLDTAFLEYNFEVNKRSDKCKYLIDLKRVAYNQLINLDIHHENINISNICTYNFEDEFHSYRRSKTKSRQWSFISS